MTSGEKPLPDGEKPDLSVVICTHNPRADYLADTLASVRAQEPLPGGRLSEFLLIDNASSEPLESRVDLSWHPDARVVREERLGLTHARLRSFHEARGDIILYIDDDNVLAPDYFRRAVEAFDADPDLGAVGGKALPRYEQAPPPWFAEAGLGLACRDLGDDEIRASWKNVAAGDRFYPECAPIGAGMAIRREAYAAYVEAVTHDGLRSGLGRKGADLASGEDNDMILTLLEQGWGVAYLPGLTLDHLIPARRVSADYLADYGYSTAKTWVQVLGVHGILPWRPVAPWTVPMRKARSWLANRAWRSDLAHIQWRKACGQFDGRAKLSEIVRP